MLGRPACHEDTTYIALFLLLRSLFIHPIIRHVLGGRCPELLKLSISGGAALIKIFLAFTFQLCLGGGFNGRSAAFLLRSASP